MAIVAGDMEEMGERATMNAPTVARRARPGAAAQSPCQRRAARSLPLAARRRLPLGQELPGNPGRRRRGGN
jgi:hypothetical protein